MMDKSQEDKINSQNVTKSQKIKKELIDIIKTIIIAIIVAFVITHFIIVNAVVPTGSMKKYYYAK